MADLQYASFLGNVDTTAWADSAGAGSAWVFNPAGTEVWWYFERDGTLLFDPRIVRLSWPSLALVDDRSIDLNSYSPTADQKKLAASGANTLVMARSATASSVTWAIEEWTLGSSTPTNIATLSGSPPQEPGWDAGDWHVYAIEWDPTADVGYALLGSSTGIGLSAYKIERSGTVTRLDTSEFYVQADGGDGNFSPVFAPNADFTAVHFSFYDFDDVAVWRAAHIDTATDAVVKGTTTKDYDIRPGLAEVGAEPFGEGVHFYPGSVTDTGHDRGDIEDPGVGTQRTISGQTAILSAQPQHVKANLTHSVGGFPVRVSDTSYDWYQFEPLYVPPATRRPVVGYIGPGLMG